MWRSPNIRKNTKSPDPHFCGSQDVTQSSAEASPTRDLRVDAISKDLPFEDPSNFVIDIEDLALLESSFFTNSEYTPDLEQGTLQQTFEPPSDQSCHVQPKYASFMIESVTKAQFFNDSSEIAQPQIVKGLLTCFLL